MLHYTDLRISKMLNFMHFVEHVGLYTGENFEDVKIYVFWLPVVLYSGKNSEVVKYYAFFLTGCTLFRYEFYRF